MLSPVSTGMGDRARVRLPEAALYSICKQPPKSTQPSTLRVVVNEYQPQGNDALRLGIKRQAWCNLQVKLCDPCLSGLEVVTTMRYTN